jgi:pilus assembly protein Flp/PilA
MHRLIRDDSGATMVEYGLMVAFIALAAFAAVQAFGGAIRGLFESVVLP